MTVLRLAAGDWTAELRPEAGAAVTALTWRGWDVLRPVAAGADPNQARGGAFVMAPWANRLDGGRLPVGDAVLALAVNRPEEDTAIHGLARDRPWRVERQAAGAAVLSLGLAAAPFRVGLRLALRLARGGVTLGMRLTHTGDRGLPMGFGWHPWFVCPPDARLRFRAGVRFMHDGRGLPVSAVADAGVDGGMAAYAGLDTHFAGWDGAAELVRPELRMVVRATGAWARNLQVYAPRGEGVLCLEPMTHIPDAPNRPALAMHGPLAVLAPGARLAAAATIVAAPP